MATIDLKDAGKKFEQLCVACHGVNGQGNGPLAENLDPKPSNLKDSNRLDQLSLYALYNVIALGIDGTGMVSFSSQLSQDDIWNLASYVTTLSLTKDAPFKEKKI